MRAGQNRHNWNTTYPFKAKFTLQLWKSRTCQGEVHVPFQKFGSLDIRQQLAEFQMDQWELSVETSYCKAEGRVEESGRIRDPEPPGLASARRVGKPHCVLTTGNDLPRLFEEQHSYD